MLKLIEELMNNNITLTNFIKEVKNTSLPEESKIHSFLDEYNDEDRCAIVYLILYYIYKYNFMQDNPFLLFLNSIEDETDNDFKKEVVFHYQKDNVVIYQIDHLYFVINNSENQTKILLPSILQNDYQFCVNCNHDLYFEEQLLLESYEFYIISDIK